MRCRQWCQSGLALVLGLLATVSAIGADTEAQRSTGRMTRGVRCGRDCAYLACRLLDVPADLDEVDRSLGYRPEVPLADVRRVLEAKGLHCHAVRLRGDNAPRLAEAIGEGAPAALAIAAVRADVARAKHFLLVVHATTDAMLVIDPSGEGVQSVSLTDLDADAELPLLLVGRDASVRHAFGFGWRRLAAGVGRVFSSWPLTVALLLMSAVLGRTSFSRQVDTRLAMLLTVLRKRFGPSIVARARSKVWRSGALRAAGGGAVLTGLALVFWPRPDRLVVTPGQVDLGRVPVGSKQTLEFRVRNDGRRTQTVEKVDVSCSCLNIDLESSKLAPGDETALSVGFMVPFEGTSEHWLLIVVKDETSKDVPVRIAYSAYESVKLSPMYFNVGEFPRGGSLEKVLPFNVKNFHGDALSLPSAQASGDTPALDAAFVDPATLSEGGEFSVRVTCRPERPLGAFAQRIVIESEGAPPQHSFVVVAHGAVVASVQVEPPALLLGDATQASQAPLTTEWVRIRSLTALLEVVSAASEPDVLQIAEQQVSDDGREVRLRVERAPGAAQGADSAVLKVVTSHPDAPRIEIPVYFLSDLPPP